MSWVEAIIWALIGSALFVFLVGLVFIFVYGSPWVSIGVLGPFVFVAGLAVIIHWIFRNDGL